MDCEPDCEWKEFDEGWWCRRFNRKLWGNSPQRVSECETEYIENQRINKSDEIKEDKRNFRR